MLLPTLRCPSCQAEVVVYRALPPDGKGPLETRCMDCNARLDRFGTTPRVTERSAEDLSAMGYANLDQPTPVAAGGCFSTRGCDGCPKIDSRPW